MLRRKLVLVGGGFLGLLALLLVVGGADTTGAQTFSPVLEVTIDDPEPEANSSYTVDFNLPEGDVNFAGLIAFIPADWGIVSSEDIPIGAIVGELSSQATLGLFNNACNNGLNINFTFVNSSIDVTDLVDYLDTDDNGIPNFVEDKDESGLPDGFEKYPDFITRVLDDEEGNPLQPLRRAAGITPVAGLPILLQFLVFEPGTVINPAIPSDPELGYPSVTLLINAGDPEAEPQPGPITDFCTPLTSSNTSLGVSKDNGCTAAVPADELDPLCEISGVPLTEGDPTDPDEGGNVLFANPQDGKYTFTTVAVGQRDADGDTYENTLDTCALKANVGNPRVQGDGDADNDGLDAACDPDDNVSRVDQDDDGYQNRQDNCPIDPNGQAEDNQADDDMDGVGDACDPDKGDADAQGTLSSALITAEATIGTGTGTGGPPAGFGGGGGDDGGGGNAIIFIIIGVVAGVLVIGGGLYAYQRRSRA